METLLSALIPITFLAAFTLERLFPAQKLPKVSWWILKGFVFFVIVAAINAVVPAIAADLVTQRVKPIDLSGIGLVPGVLAVMIAAEVLAYIVHRTLHRVHFLWRWTHQMHHSAERLDIAGFPYFHPFDIAVQAGVPSLLVCLLGVTPDAAALAGFLGFVLAMFQHLNVKTPHWLGYVILRPEQHSLHHARGVHRFNYGNFAFMDLLSGTFQNPKEFSKTHGFWDGASARMGAMLLGRDVAR